MPDNQATQLPRLHFITDTQCQNRWSDIQLATAVLEGGGELIQYRDKLEDSTRTRLERAQQLAQVCQQHGATLIINDRADIAKCTNGAGLHLGPTDLSITNARQIIGLTPVIGATINHANHARALVDTPPNYVGIGPFRATSNKEAATYSLGLQGMQALLSETQTILGRDIPAIAIGGIRLEDVAPLIRIGFHGVAVIGAIAKAECPTTATRAFIETISKALEVD